MSEEWNDGLIAFLESEGRTLSEEQQDALRLSYRAWIRDVPLSVDEVMAITGCGFDPDELEKDWEFGWTP